MKQIFVKDFRELKLGSKVIFEIKKEYLFLLDGKAEVVYSQRVINSSFSKIGIYKGLGPYLLHVFDFLDSPLDQKTAYMANSDDYTSSEDDEYYNFFLLGELE
jgi:hypothetical protein